MRERDTSGSARVLAIYTSTGRERDIAVWTSCEDVVRNLDAYREAPFVETQALREKHDFLERLRELDYDMLRDAAQTDPMAFGTYRNAVLDLEGSNARKLQVLVWTLRELYRLRDLPSCSNPSLIDPLTESVGNALHFSWKLADVPLDGDYRDWAVKNTRRYDLLPRSWRYV